MLAVALVGGPAYDALYQALPQFTAQTGVEVKVGFQAPHMALNRHLEAMESPPYDLISTHGKYAPSQLRFLAPLESIFSSDSLSDFFPAALEIARVGGRLYGIPRNIDVRLLHYRTDLLPSPPATWDDLLETARRLNRPPELYGFAFPGKESGLFGTFYELVESAGGRLFPPSLQPEIVNTAGEWALGLLRAFIAEGLVPPETPDWHFDEVHAAFRSGHVALMGEWPGYYGLLCDRTVSEVADRFAVARYPAGPSGLSKAYGGGHTFALTKAGAGKPEAVELLRFLTSPERQSTEASRGMVPVRKSVMERVRAGARSADLERWRTLEHVMAEDVVIPPKVAFYPEIEDVLWTTVQQAVLGTVEIRAALEHMTAEISALVARRQSS